MTHHGIALHHLHKKADAKKSGSSPRQEAMKRFIDKSIFFIGMISPVMTIPQILKIWFEKSAEGVSAISWFTYMIVSVFWLFYGIIHKEKAIIVVHSSWIVLSALVAIGTLLYS